MTEKEYRELNKISYSKLAGLSKSPASLISSREIWNNGIQFGSMVDMLLFDGKEKFNNEFCTIDYTPSKFIASVIDEVVKLNNPFGSDLFPPLEKSERNIELACKKLNYGQTWKKETRINKILKAEKYYLYLKKCVNKRVVDKEEFDKAITAVNSLQTSNFTSHYFKAEEGKEIFYQVPVIWECKEVECKSLFDMLIVDHELKTVQVCDLKTTSSSIYSFPNSFLEWQYYLQAAMYTDALIYAIKNPEAFKINIPDLKGYTILPFDFVVISQTALTKPLVYRTPLKFLEAGRYGGVINGEKVRGYRQLIDDYKWHLKNGVYDYQREVYEAKGIISLSINGNN